MKALYVEGNTIHRIEEMSRQSLVCALKKIFKKADFNGWDLRSLRSKLNKCITSESLSFKDFN